MSSFQLHNITQVPLQPFLTHSWFKPHLPLMSLQ